MSKLDKLYIPELDVWTARVGFGGCPMGLHDWGITNENDLIEAVHSALDSEISFFDTADIYGLGESERILGKALKGRRNRALIATKFGVRRSENLTFYDNSPKWIDKAIENSLLRLGTDYIDFYQLHYWDEHTPIFDIIEKLQELKRVGKIRAFGVTNINLLNHGYDYQIEGLASFSFEYSLANRMYEPIIIDTIKKLSTVFLSWGSLGQGVLSGKFDNNTQFLQNDRRRKSEYVNFHGEKLISNLKIVNYLGSILHNYDNKTISQLAIRWILDEIDQSIALIGMKNSNQVELNRGALDFKIFEQHLEELCKLSTDK